LRPFSSQKRQRAAKKQRVLRHVPSIYRVARLRNKSSRMRLAAGR